MLRLDIGLLIAALAAPLAAQDVRCPLDGGSIPPTPAAGWNSAGGRDSDGCTWSVDLEGRWRITALDAVVTCPACGLSLERQHFALPWEGEGLARLRAARDRAAGTPSSPLPAAAAQLNAARVYAALDGQAPLSGCGPAFQAALTLRAAWAARAAVLELAGPLRGYRPRGAGEALATLEQLERGLQARTRRSPVDLMLEDLDLARALSTEGTADPTTQLRLTRLRGALIRIEQSLFKLRTELPPSAERDAQLETLALAGGWTRFGDPDRAERWLVMGERRWGAALGDVPQRLRVAWVEERRLLQLASQAWSSAAAGTSDPAEAARLHVLAGDAARRAGEWARARQLLEQGRRLDPRGGPAALAELLLGQRGG